MLAVLKWLLEANHPRDLYDLNRFSRYWYGFLFMITCFAFFFPKSSLLAYGIWGIALAVFQHELRMRNGLRKIEVNPIHVSILAEYSGDSTKMVEMAHKIDREHPFALLCQFDDGRYLRSHGEQGKQP